MAADNAQTVPPNNTVKDALTSIEDNVLDKFDLPTYHLRFYMMSDDAIRLNIFGPKAQNQRVVIAESGVTKIEIDEVEIKSVSGISRTAGIGTATEFSLSLKEPFGASLLDQISNAAKFLGVKNFAKVPFFLEVSFKGRKAGDGQNQAAGSRGELADLVWTWPIILTKMSLDVNTGGTVYQIQAAIYGDLASTNPISDAQKPMSVEAITVGEFFTEYQKLMNDRAKEKKNSAAYEHADIYEFFIDEDIAKAQIVPDLIEERQSRDATFAVKDDKIAFTFVPPISVDRVVENVLSLTSFFEVDFIGDDTTSEDDTFTRLYRVITDTIMGEYDEVRSDYQRTYRYLIIPYEMSTVTTPAKKNAVQTDEQLYNAKVRKGRVRKLYNYIYTGLNDQVLDFELVFNFNWYAALPLQAGQSTNPAAAEVKQTLSDEQRSASEENADTIDQGRSFAANPAGFAPFSFFEDALAEFTSPLADLQDQTQNRIDAASAQISDAVGGAIANADAAAAGIQSGIEGVAEIIPGVAGIPGVGVSTEGLVAGTQQLRVNTPTIGSATSAQDGLREQDIFLDDPRIGKEILLQQSITESKSGDASADVAQGSQTSNRTMLSAMFEQAKSPVAGDLLDIDLNIKGDPYWLEPPPIHRNDPPRSTFNRMLKDRGFPKKTDDPNEGETVQEEITDQNFSTANASDAQTFMVFRSFTPLEFDPETGITPAGKKSNNVLNGVYGVRMVTHSFSGGVFTQTLHGIRDPSINLSNVNLLAHLGVSESENPLNDDPADTGEDSTTQRSDIGTTDDAAGGSDAGGGSS